MGADGISIRSDLRPGDVGEIVRWHGVTYAREHGFDVEFEGYVAGRLGDFATRRSERERIWIAERGSQIVGCVAIVDGGAGSDIAQLRWFLVDPSARGAGLGTRLLESAIAFSAEKGFRRVTLWTVAQLLAAARLYRAAGFHLAEERHAHHWGVDVVEQRYEREL